MTGKRCSRLLPFTLAAGKGAPLPSARLVRTPQDNMPLPHGLVKGCGGQQTCRGRKRGNTCQPAQYVASHAACFTHPRAVHGLVRTAPESETASVAPAARKAGVNIRKTS